MARDRVIFESKVRLPEMPSLDEAGFKEFSRWYYQGRIAAMPYSKFKDAIIQTLLPEIPEDLAEPLAKDLNLGDISLQAVFTPTHERPAYGRALDTFETCLRFLRENFKAGKKQFGIVAVKNKPYIAVDLFTRAFTTDLQNELKGKEELEEKLYFTAPHDLAFNVPESITVVYGRNYSAFVESNARDAAESWNFIKEGHKRARAFKKKLLDDSLGRLDTFPGIMVEVPYTFGDVSFRHVIIPENTPRNKAVVDALVAPLPEVLTDRSRGHVGEYTLLSNWQDSALIFVEKGLADAKFIRDYDPTIIRKKTFVALGGVESRLAGYREASIHQTINQRVYTLFL